VLNDSIKDVVVEPLQKRQLVFKMNPLSRMLERSRAYDEFLETLYIEVNGEEYYEGSKCSVKCDTYKKVIEIARKLLSLGLSIDQVVAGTGLSIEEIENLMA